MNAEKKERLEKVRSQIETACKSSGRARDEVKLVAVSKKKSWEEVRDFLELGQVAFGENYVQEALDKQESLEGWMKGQGGDLPVQWHFIGHLQSNKAKLIPGKFSLLHSLDSFELAEKLNKTGIPLNCLLEINLDAQTSKGGVSPPAAAMLLEKLAPLASVKVKGLMCIPDPHKQRDPRYPFHQLRKMKDELNRSGAYRHPLTELSMGMSSDFQDAILEGATIVRVGTSLFGERTK